MALAGGGPGLRHRGRGRVRLIVLPQVIQGAQDPGDGQNCDGVGPNPAHCEPMRRAPELSQRWSGLAVIWAGFRGGGCTALLMPSAAADSFGGSKPFCWSIGPGVGIRSSERRGPSAASFLFVRAATVRGGIRPRVFGLFLHSMQK